MSSHARSREEERRLSIRTLIIASIGSAMAAIVTSQFWIAGTPVAAAVTPVIVALVSELLNRPTEKIAQRLTTDIPAVRQESEVLPEAAGAGPPPPRQEWNPRTARDEPEPLPEPYVREAGRAEEPEYRVYRAAPQRRGLHWKVIFGTAAIAFAIAAAFLTLPELIAGDSVGKGDRNFTLWGGGKKKDAPTEQDTQTQETQPGSQAPQPQQTTPQPEPEETTPEPTTPEPQTTQPPAQTTPVPRSQAPTP
jgi:hypothetical protein